MSRVLVTGAAGSIGSELAKELVRLGNHVLGVDINETGLFDLDEVHTQVMDIRDSYKVHSVFEFFKPEIVFHCAAYKHVPMMEEEVYEAVKTNFMGTITVLAEAKQQGVKFVFLSTDKAVEPHSVMGMTKALAERAVLNAGGVVVRLVNVIGSRGSVGQVWSKQAIDGKPITLTAEHATRYFMKMDDAVAAIIDAGSRTSGVYLPAKHEHIVMGQLAKQYAIGVPIIVTGLRRGEVMHEKLTNEKFEKVGGLLLREVPATCISSQKQG